MSNKITGKEYPLSKVFDADFEYHIPGYQRPYAWTEEEMCDIMTPTNLNSHHPNISSVISGYKQPSKSAQSIEITGFIEKSKPPEIIFLYTLLPLTA